MRHSLILISIFLFANHCFGQSLVKRNQDVFNRVKETDEGKDYQIDSLENEDFLPQMTDGGGKLVGYFEDGELVKMEVKIFMSYGIKTFVYYFSGGELFYVNERFEQFTYDSKTDKVDSSKTEQTFNGDYIFKDGKLIDLETLGHNRFEDDELNPEVILLKEAYQYKKLIDREK